MEGPFLNTDREIWRGPKNEWGDDFYSPSIHVTQTGGIGIDVDGHVIVMDVRDWHAAGKMMHNLAGMYAGDQMPPDPA